MPRQMNYLDLDFSILHRRLQQPSTDVSHLSPHAYISEPKPFHHLTRAKHYRAIELNRPSKTIMTTAQASLREASLWICAG